MTRFLIQKDIPTRFGTAFILFALVLAGYCLRVRNLGNLSLIADEGIQALAVKGILEYGLPKVDSGYIYCRALPFLYLQAAATKLFSFDPFWLRFPSAVFGSLVVVPAYMLGKTLFNKRVGLLAAAILSFSVWEIELSRYARFYTIFQFGFIFSLIWFYRGFMQDEGKYKLLFLLAALGTYTTHELGKVLIILFIIPLIFNAFTVYRKLIFSLWAIALVLLLKTYSKLEGFLNASDVYIGSAVVQKSETIPRLLEKIRAIIGVPSIYLPDMTLFSLALKENQMAIVLLLAIAGSATVYIIYRYFRGTSFLQSILFIAMVWLSLFYMFGLVILLFAVYIIILYQNHRTFWEPVIGVVYGVIALCFIFWIILCFENPEFTIKRTIFALFGFPPFYMYFLKWFVRGWPIMTVVSFIGSITLLWQYISDRDKSAPFYAVGTVMIPAVLTSFFISYNESRYIFHLYPMIVIVFSMTAITAGHFFLKMLPIQGKRIRGLIIGFMIAAVFFISQDANLLNAWAVSNRTYQSAKDPFRSVISWWFYAGYHQDFMGPSLYVREHISSGDKIVALGPLHMVGLYHFYTGDVAYTVVPSQYKGLLKQGKFVNYITGSEYISGVSDLKTMLERSSGGAWMLGDRMLLAEKNDFYSESMKDYLRHLTRNPDFVGSDNKSFAVKVR